MSKRILLGPMAVLAAACVLLGACGIPAEGDASSRDDRPAQRGRARPQWDGRRSPTQRAPRPVPEHDFTVRTFSAETFRLSDHLGTPVVINFWESW